MLVLKICLSAIAWACVSAAAFHERLLLKPLPRGSLLASFDFFNSLSQHDFDNQNYGLFPRSLGQILHHAHVKELHLRFTTGRWDEEVWGKRTAKEGGTGVEIWAWIDTDKSDGADEQLERRWSTLVNSISGLFCASVQNVDSTRVVTPLNTFERQSVYANDTRSLRLVHGMLPNEVVCTENLTPFMKLLPCKGKAGISSLFDGHRIFDSNWQNMAVDVRTVCSSETEVCMLELEQNVAMVVDVERSKRSLDDPLPRPVAQSEMVCDDTKPYHHYGDSCFPTAKPNFPSFSISEVFGKPVQGQCPLGDMSGRGSVCVSPAQDQTIQVNTSSPYTEIGFESSYVRTCYEPAVGASFDLDFSLQAEASSSEIVLPSSSLSVIQASRTMTGQGQEFGGVRTVFLNRSPTSSVTFVYLDTLPWFLRPYLHTLRSDIALNNGTAFANDSMPEHPIQNLHYRPAIDRKRATHIELTLTVPADSTLTLHYEVEKTVLRYAEYPPDANRGFDLPAAVIRVISNDNASDEAERQTPHDDYVRTTTLLLYLMTPDFSMPYNVIILSSTVIALGFGSMFNLLVRRLVTQEEADAARGGGLIGKLRTRISALKQRASRKAKSE